MKTDGIKRLVSALGKTPYQQSPKVNQAEASNNIAKASNTNNDAVKVSLSGFQPKTNQTETAERAKKIDDIKAQVANGSYNVSSEKLATSLVGELGF